MKGNTRREHDKARKELEQSIHLVKDPLSLKEDPALVLPKLKVKTSQPQEENLAMEE